MRHDPLVEGDFPETWSALRAGVAEGVAPGFVAGIWEAREPARARVAAIGSRRLQPTPQPMLPDTVFDLASVSKVFATATLAHTLVDRGWISFETPLARILPGYPHRRIALGHLLAHTAGLPAWQPLFERLRERFGAKPIHAYAVEDRQREMRRLVEAVEPEAKPDERAVYSDISFLLLGFALEEVAAMPLDRAVRELVWKPMGFTGAFFVRTTRAATDPASIDERVAATESCPWRGAVLQGTVHDDNCWAMGGYGGHAGAFGTAADVLAFAAALFPRSGHAGFLSPATLRAAWSRVPKPPGCERTLGWDTPSGETPSFGRLFSPRSVGHLGFTGTSLWIDPDAGLAVTLLSNRVHPSRENNLIRAFRPRFHEALARDLALQR